MYSRNVSYLSLLLMVNFFMKTNGGIKLCISCWHVIDKCIIMHWHRKRKQRQGCAVAEPGGPWLLTSLSGSLQFFLRAQPWMILMTFLYPNVVKFVSELLIIVPWDECKYCFLRGKNNKKATTNSTVFWSFYF